MNIAEIGFLRRRGFKNKITLVRYGCLLLAGMLVLSAGEVISQQADADTLQWLSQYFTDAYQADQHLIHGTRYYNLYPKAPGNPFFETEEFRTGTIIISDREYKPVQLKYDICNQRLLLRYSLNVGGSADIVLIHDPIREFEIDGKVFRRYAIPKKGEQFCQEIGTGSLKCIYFWHKELIPLNNSLESFNQYSNHEKNSWLLHDGVLFPFTGKKSFIRCFPAEQQHALRKYIKENRIIIRHVADAEMQRLIRFYPDQEGATGVKIQGNP